jgi:adenylate cyclase
MSGLSDLIGRAPGGRKLIAIVHADMVGYSRLIGLDDIGTLERLRTLRRILIDPAIDEHGGRIVQTAGDSLLIMFDSINGAVRCAITMQQRIPDSDGDWPVNRAIRFRIGINIGDVIADGTDLHGDGVNVAVRLQAECPPGAICVSRAVRDHVHGHLNLVFEELGALSLKNIPHRVEAFVLRCETKAVTSTLPSRAPLSYPMIGQPNIPRLSVLVALTPSATAEDEHLLEALATDITTDLSRTPGSFVVGRAEAVRRFDDSASPRDIAHELGVNYVVQGSIRATRERFGANVQLIDVETGGHLWAERFEIDRGGSAGDRSDLIGRLIRTLSVKLAEDVSRRIEALPPSVWTSYDLLMRGRAMALRPSSAASRHAAIECFEQALDRDPDSVDARIGIASMLIGNIADGWSKSIERDEVRAERLLLDTLHIDGDICLAHACMGVLRRVQGRLQDSYIELEIATGLAPDNITAISQLGITLAYLGRPEAAISQVERSLRLAPHDSGTPISWLILGICHLLLGHIDDAINCARRSRARNPQLFGTHFILAAALGLRGDLDEASATLRHAIALRPDLDSLSSMRALPYHNDPQFIPLFERTIVAGLQAAGLPADSMASAVNSRSVATSPFSAEQHPLLSPHPSLRS